ncbi:unnamed protein product [Amoebophrya sp. A25]|nr:unnamed protein product [Amoebophrya sp. A25]|eukprot:GSA25T00007787001.1
MLDRPASKRFSAIPTLVRSGESSLLISQSCARQRRFSHFVSLLLVLLSVELVCGASKVASPVDPCRDEAIPELPKSTSAALSEELSDVEEAALRALKSSVAGQPDRAEPGDVVLVTGGSGFIGSNLVELLLEYGYEVRVLDNLETGNILYLNLLDNPKLRFIFGDILDRAALEKAVKVDENTGSTSNDNTRPKKLVGIFHLAAASKVLPSLVDPAMATHNVRNNALGTANLLEISKGLPHLRKIVYAASSTYYGNRDPPLREDMLFSVSSPYAASKYMGELQFDTFDKVHNVPSLNLRFFMVYGPRNPRRGGYAVVTGIFAEQKKAGQKLTIEGHGKQYRDFVHVHDVARACLLAMQSEFVRGTSINVGSGRAHSILEAAEIVAPGEERTYLPARRNDLKGTLADTCRARRELRFATEKVFEVEMTALVQQTLQGRGDYTYEEMERALGVGVFGADIWESLTLDEKNARIRDQIVKEGKLEAALASFRQKTKALGVKQGSTTSEL